MDKIVYYVRDSKHPAGPYLFVSLDKRAAIAWARDKPEAADVEKTIVDFAERYAEINSKLTPLDKLVLKEIQRVSNEMAMST